MHNIMISMWSTYLSIMLLIKLYGNEFEHWGNTYSDLYSVLENTISEHVHASVNIHSVVPLATTNRPIFINSTKSTVNDDSRPNERHFAAYNTKSTAQDHELEYCIHATWYAKHRNITDR